MRIFRLMSVIIYILYVMFISRYFFLELHLGSFSFDWEVLSIILVILFFYFEYKAYKKKPEAQEWLFFIYYILCFICSTLVYFSCLQIYFIKDILKSPEYLLSLNFFKIRVLYSVNFKLAYAESFLNTLLNEHSLPLCVSNHVLRIIIGLEGEESLAFYYNLSNPYFSLIELQQCVIDLVESYYYIYIELDNNYLTEENKYSFIRKIFSTMFFSIISQSISNLSIFKLIHNFIYNRLVFFINNLMFVFKGSRITYTNYYLENIFYRYIVMFLNRSLFPFIISFIKMNKHFERPKPIISSILKNISRILYRFFKGYFK